MSEMSLEEQIRCMQDMRDKLDEFCKIMRNNMDSFQDDIKYLRSQGFSTETEETYQKNYYLPANDNVDHVIHNIYNLHFDYIDRVINDLDAALHEE